MHYRWTVCAVVACLGPLLVSTAVAANEPANTQMSASANRPSAPVPVLNWAPCVESAAWHRSRLRHGHRAARLRRPARRDDADSHSHACRQPIRPIASARYSSIRAVPAARASTWWLSASARLSQQQLQGRFDVVGFDPRGIARSSPLQCFDSLDEVFAYIGCVPIFPYLREQERPFFDVCRGLARICSERRLPIMQHMSTADVVRDLDLLRRAVGDEKLTYLGFSYGSYIGNTYANMFPQNSPRAGDRRRARSAAVVERRADHFRPCRDRGGVRRIPATVR